MLTTTLQRDLEITLEAALMLAEPDTPVPALAERIYDAEPDLMQQLHRPWVVERLVWMLHRKRNSVVPVNQLPLPGFEKLPRRLVLKGGKRAPLRNATLMQLRQYRATLWKKRDPKIETLDSLIALVALYAKEFPGITVAEAMSRELDKLQKH